MTNITQYVQVIFFCCKEKKLIKVLTNSMVMTMLIRL